MSTAEQAGQTAEPAVAAVAVQDLQVDALPGGRPVDLAQHGGGDRLVADRPAVGVPQLHRLHQPH